MTDHEVDQRAAQTWAERRELMRIAAQAAITRAQRGEVVDPEHLTWCRDFVAANPPLGRPLTEGTP